MVDKMVATNGFYLLLLLITLEEKLVVGRLMNFTKTEVAFNSKYIKNMTAWLDKGLLNIDIVTEQELQYGLRGSIAVQIKMQNSKNYQRLFAYDYDLCKMLSEISKDSIINLWYRTFLKSGNFMENCPIAKGHYFIYNLRLDPGTIPVFLRSGEYQINSIDYYGKRKTKSFEQVVRFAVYLRIY
ncbi:uncharacterized protein [Musca autumnalis]|uniref:uncharacterized protein n=1 Tax=Musca autumnalis TaxID=221902 RepID=UPI003CEF2689